MAEGVQTYLRADERLIWRGRPTRGVRFSASDIVAIPFSLVWTGLVVSFMGMGAGQLFKAPLPFVLFPLIFLTAGAYVTVGRFIHDAWLRSRMEYAVTDRRVLILHRVFSDDLTALDIGRLDVIKLKGGRNGGRGDIVFGREASLFGFGARGFRQSLAIWTPSLSSTPAFLGVEGARALFDRIENLRAERRSA